jgi:hypothetical protein
MGHVHGVHYVGLSDFSVRGAARRHFSRQVAQLFRRKLPTVKSTSKWACALDTWYSLLYTVILSRFTIWSNYKIVKVTVTLRLAVYGQSVRLGVKPLETHYQRFFFFFWQLNPCCHSPNVTSFLTRGLGCLLYAWPFVKCTYRTYNMLLKILAFALYAYPLSVQALQSRSCLSYISYATTAA